MTLLIDAGSYIWNQSYRPNFSWDTTDQLVEAGAIFCMDSGESIRKKKLPWYKAQRAGIEKNYPDISIHRARVDRFVEFFYRRYDKSCYLGYKGAEADDVIGMHVREGDIVMSLDKDLLTIPEQFQLIDTKMVPWGIERFEKKTKCKLSRGNSFLTYQLLNGDNADNIPRLLHTNDRLTGKWILSQENPLKWAIAMLPEQKVMESLAALLIPTPLLYNADPITYACEVYGC